ncbi:DnaJ family domain-containing protein [Gracilibacillus sp. S3-1-1]|uniref:DnaJ family domain-containing protein n=1 Tax=Gracilibacillus pellucidus TaxID=3095368 RepID=A0ACC6M194_9BACI|nr:DnaJ family domain-containing protein [Gracilibacillus sp. S3-1-1]MDX8044728.1 DnaJ family domain-containing protein [Gracilibacillus sp. S3-1-1]
MDREYNDLIGDILEASGEKDRVKGKGKPLSKEYLQMDTFQHFQKTARDAGYLPIWLRLQKEISSLVHSCTSESEVKVINKKIAKYNTMCPTSMQKNVISLQDIDKAKSIW